MTTIIKLTNPNSTPVDGDWIRVVHDNGAIEEKFYYAPVEVVPDTPVVPWTKKEFLLKFTPAEYAAIAAATKSNATLDYYWQLFMVAENVLKTDPATIDGIKALESAGLLATGRSAAILA